MKRSRFYRGSDFSDLLRHVVPDDILDRWYLTLSAASEFPRHGGRAAFFVLHCYGSCQFRAGFLVERWGEKSIMVDLSRRHSGACHLRCIPPSGRDCFLVRDGRGMAALQVPSIRCCVSAGGEEHFAFNSALPQLVFGAASFLSPWVYSYLVTSLNAAHPAEGDSCAGSAADTGEPSVGLDLLVVRVSTAAMACSSGCSACPKYPPRMSRRSLWMYATIIGNYTEEESAHDAAAH